MPTLLTVEHLAYATPTGRLLASDVAFELSAGQTLVITGPNGVGKSSLLQVLLGQQKPLRGRVDYAASARSRRYLPQLQNREFHIPMTLLDVLTCTGSGPFDRQAALKVGLLRPTDLAVAWNTASGGERQKTLLTQALMARPNILFLDEPLNHLDRLTRQMVTEATAAFVETGDCAVITVCHEQGDGVNEWRRATYLNLNHFVPTV